jgi:arginine-tRNA-protein transferase
MQSSDQEAFTSFLGSAWADTLFYEFRLDKRLVAVAVVDQLEDAYSAVYTFFDPTLGERSLGRFAILYEIVAAQRLGLSWLYLGYWIPGCRQMQYKNDYQPLQAYWQNEWIAFEELPGALPSCGV